MRCQWRGQDVLRRPPALKDCRWVLDGHLTSTDVVVIRDAYRAPWDGGVYHLVLGVGAGGAAKFHWRAAIGETCRTRALLDAHWIAYTIDKTGVLR